MTQFLSYLLAVFVALLDAAKCFLGAHLTVGYWIAAVLALPSVALGQGMKPYIGPTWADVLTVVLEWGSFLFVYGFIRRGGLNPLMRRLCPWRSWDGAWWKANWARGFSRMLKRRSNEARTEGAEPVPVAHAEDVVPSAATPL
jgi:hypothetical protein